jgi:hypothetical protein
LSLLPRSIVHRNRAGCHESLCVTTTFTAMKYVMWQKSLVPRNNVCGNKTYYIRIFHVAIHSYCYKVCLMHKHPNAMLNYVVIKIIATILVVTSIINCNASFRGNNHDYCNNIEKPLQSAIAT